MLGSSIVCEGLGVVDDLLEGIFVQRQDLRDTRDCPSVVGHDLKLQLREQKA